MRDLDREYLERRRQESLTRAELATDQTIARIHRDFAEAYARKLEAGKPKTLRIT